MRRILVAAALAVIAIGASVAFAAVDINDPRLSFGALTPAAATATAVPTTCLRERTGVAIYNGDAATIWVGGSTVTNSTGFPVEASGKVTLEVSCSGDAAARVYVYSVAGTAASAVRYLETR